MFADTLTLTIGGVARVLAKVNQDNFCSEYRLVTTTDQFTLTLKNTNYTDKKTGQSIDRHTIQVLWTVFPVSPSTLSIPRKAYTVFENVKGDNLTDPRNTALGLYAFLTSANIDKLIGFES